MNPRIGNQIKSPMVKALTVRISIQQETKDFAVNQIISWQILLLLLLLLLKRHSQTDIIIIIVEKTLPNGLFSANYKLIMYV